MARTILFRSTGSRWPLRLVTVIVPLECGGVSEKLSRGGWAAVGAADVWGWVVGMSSGSPFSIQRGSTCGMPLGPASSGALSPCRGLFGHAGWWKDVAAGGGDPSWIARLEAGSALPPVAPKPGCGICRCRDREHKLSGDSPGVKHKMLWLATPFWGHGSVQAAWPLALCSVAAQRDCGHAATAAGMPINDLRTVVRRQQMPARLGHRNDGANRLRERGRGTPGAAHQVFLIG